MYKDPRYDNSALGKLRRLLCSCLDPNTRIHIRRRRFSHQKRALLLMAAIGALLLWNSGNEPEPPTMLRGGGLAGSILVVGGFGFVGAALVEQALDLDYKVFVMDSSAAYRTAQPRSPLIKYIDSDTVPHDGRAGPYADAMELVPNGVDHVVYAAGVQDNGERHSIWDSAEGVRHVLEWCGDRRVSDFVLLSSMDVCRLSTAQSEELQVEACVSPAEVLLKHKRVSTLTAPARKALESELVMEDLCAKEDDVDEAMWEVKCGVLRLSEPYGDGIEDGPLAELLAKVEADEPIEVPEEDVPRDCERTDQSLPSFSFQPPDSLSLVLCGADIHVDDVATALLKTLRGGLSEKVLRLSICSGETTTIESFAQATIEASRESRSVMHLPTQRDNGAGTTCDVRYALRAIGFQAGIGVPEGVLSLLPPEPQPDDEGGYGR